MNPIKKTLALAAALAGVSLQVFAQSAAVEFRVTPTDRNPASCQRWDAELSRVHTFTLTSDGATLHAVAR